MLHQVGVGALGPVFRTYEPERDRLVAVKVFRLDITPEQAQALADELSRAPAAGLFHPSIVEPIAAGVEGSVAFAAEEYVAADTLDAVMREYAPAAVETILPWITQLAGAIDFARAAGVGHGGLHPRDIFVTPEEVRATGFGVVEALDRLGLRAPVRRPYAPPERIAVQPWGTPADVFSLAAITFELLTGRRPAGLGPEIGSVAPGPNEGPDGVWAVLARAMDADPAQRFQTALAFASALEAAAHADAAPRPAPRPVAASAPAAVTAASLQRPVPSEDEDEDEDEDEEEAVPEEAAGDDILGEQEEDEAHHQLTLHEVESEQRRPLSLLDDESEGEADADRLMAGAAAAGAADRMLDDYGADRAPRSDPGAGLHAAPVERTPARGGGQWRDRTPGATAGREETGRKWPVAAVLILGLLGGLLAGYGLWGRTPAALAPPGEAAERDVASEPAAAPAAPQDPAPAAADGGPVSAPVAVTPPPAATEPPARRPAPTPTGTIVVRSTPSRAGVTVDGEWKGRTPLTLGDLPLARYAVRVVQPGYLPVERTVSLTSADPSGTLSVRLRRSPEADSAAAPPRAAPAGPRRYTGSIYVDSRPRGARVSINGKAVGVTPLRVPEIPIGSHVVRMELPDHRIWSSATRVAAGEEARVTGSLERIR